MSTRSTIARKIDGGFQGVYHHWDGYPTGLGQTLFDLFNTYFDRNLEFMLKVLIDDHPGGWSTINGKNFMETPGFKEFNFKKKSEEYLKSDQPNCYCHGDRNEKGWEVTHENASASGCEFAYVFDEKTNEMWILSSFKQNGDKMIGMFGMGDDNAIWKPIGKVDLMGEEPDWELINESEPLQTV